MLKVDSGPGRVDCSTLEKFWPAGLFCVHHCQTTLMFPKKLIECEKHDLKRHIDSLEEDVVVNEDVGEDVCQDDPSGTLGKEL